MSVSQVKIRQTEDDAPQGAPAVVGKDLLELISSAMYVEPLTVFREYVQNAADSIDDARAAGVLGDADAGTVEIQLEPGARSIRIRDNGMGIPADQFEGRMRAIGASTKRGSMARGFRGVGRLGGLAYAQRLIFRSRSTPEEPVREMIWDCRRLRTGIKSQSVVGLGDFVTEITSVTNASGDFPPRFFEVELAGVVRQGDDRLLRAETVADYLAQVTPVPFAEEFSLGRDIEAFLAPHRSTPPLTITVNDGAPLRRPYRDDTPAGLRSDIRLRELSTFEIPGMDGGLAALGWVAHHDYDGAIPSAARIKGLRARVGDLQIGGSSLLEEIFPEARFSSWTVGEVHVLDPKILPNGRRDNFEQNGHYANLLNHLSPVARDIARRCRSSSADRQRTRAFETQAAAVDEQLDVLEQGALGDQALVELSATLEKAVARVERTALAADMHHPASETMRERSVRQRERLVAICGTEQPPSPLDRLPDERRAIYQEMIDLIYQCSVNRIAAKSLVDRILEKLD
ncbi:hypothetical protein HMP09_1922 [Sphingomonas sp. HMP9]|uniref:ATP-binding protein n=1 Tax=Sphingomonas sp. HMP9 TaxID=1517554 RepID=UPI001596C025|nr:ATP-binding protein [Sphingomonas sp. HMP9]BCA62688.1 hypothetical protein HMP09_1922 [Sphingomonas sp. HMP9]